MCHRHPLETGSNKDQTNHPDTELVCVQRAKENGRPLAHLLGLDVLLQDLLLLLPHVLLQLEGFL